MSPHHLRSQFIQTIHRTYPNISMDQLNSLIPEQMLSPLQVTLPKKALLQAQDFVREIFSFRDIQAKAMTLMPEFQSLNLVPADNNAILMSYDFHWDSDRQLLKLIEINTNAAFLALGDLMYKCQGLPNPVDDFNIDELKANILNELKLNKKAPSGRLKAAIIDDQPVQQRLYAEFLIYLELFRAWGWDAEILDFRNVPASIDFIYNRYTDFTFSQPQSSALKHGYNERRFTLSPHPAEYLYLADKSRLIEWSLQGENPLLTKHLPKTQAFSAANADQIWQNRKNIFIKPRRSFGSKQAYKAAKMSRKLFDELLSQDFIAQELVPPSEIKAIIEGVEQSFRYDLRFYVYQDRVQSIVARIYQGQVTNLQTPYGGFAPVVWESKS